MNVKLKFPTEASLQHTISQQADLFTQHIQKQIGHLEAEFIRMKKRRTLGFFYFFWGTLLFLMSFLIPRTGLLGLGKSMVYIFLCFIIFQLILIYLGWQRIEDTKEPINRFHEAFKETVFPLLFELFDLHAQRVAIEKNKILALLDQSELITEKRNTVTVDDMLQIAVGNKTLFVTELDAKHITGSGKSRKVKQLFTGYFLSFDLDITLDNKTFLSTQGDTSGFGHQSFWKLLKQNGVQETTLEWNEFEALIHVATTNPSEARYLLSPDFMHDLYEWWKNTQRNIRISFIGNRMYMLFPDNRIRFGKTVDTISRDEIASYLESVSMPLLHVLHLIQDTKEQFNRID